MVKIILLCLSFSAFALEPFTLPIFKSAENYSITKDLGKKTIVINFWASWCTACIAEIPLLNKFKQHHKDRDVRYLAINAGEKNKKIKKFLKKHEFHFLILKDKDRKTSKKLGIVKLPRTLIIDKKKKIIYDSDAPPPLSLKL